MTARADGPAYRRLHGCRILTCDAEGSCFEPGELWLRGDRIAALGPVGSTSPPGGAESARPVEQVDLSGRIVIPGLVNAHTHSYAALLKGTVDTLPLDVYMLHVIAKGAERSAREVYVSALLDCITMIRSGTTAAIDHFSHRPIVTDEALDAAMRAFYDSGLRAAVAPMFADLPYLETIPLDPGALPAEVRDAYAKAPRPAPGDYFAVVERALSGLGRFGGRIGLLLGVDGPQRCSAELLDMTGDFQRDHRLGLHTHMLETRTQAAMAGPRGLVRALTDRSILDDRSSLVHFIWCGEDDVAAAREAGVTLVHCPSSTLLVGSGLSPTLRLHRAGLALAAGTDGANCGPVNMFDKIRMACQLQHATEPDFEAWLPAGELFRILLAGGARALGHAGEIGVLAAGAKADLTVLDPASHWHRPMGDVWSHVVHYESGAGVESVYVDGRPVLDRGTITTFDEAAILAEAEDIVARKRADHPAAEAAIARQYPAFRDMVVETNRRQDGMDRLFRLP